MGGGTPWAFIDLQEEKSSIISGPLILQEGKSLKLAVCGGRMTFLYIVKILREMY
jgi:hypothetical protein